MVYEYLLRPSRCNFGWSRKVFLDHAINIYFGFDGLEKPSETIQTACPKHKLILIHSVFLPPANEVWGKVIFLHQFVILFTWGGLHGCSGGACMVALGVCMVAPGEACVVALGGACMVLFGGVHGFIWGGCAWFYSGGVRGFIQGCVVLYGGGGRAWFFQFFRIQWDTVNERAVRILLECILVTHYSLQLLGSVYYGRDREHSIRTKDQLSTRQKQ